MNINEPASLIDDIAILYYQIIFHIVYQQWRVRTVRGFHLFGLTLWQHTKGPTTLDDNYERAVRCAYIVHNILSAYRARFACIIIIIIIKNETSDKTCTYVLYVNECCWTEIILFSEHWWSQTFVIAGTLMRTVYSVKCDGWGLRDMLRSAATVV